MEGDKLSDNVPGKYFVTNHCIDCQLCEDFAPDNFACNEEEEYYYVCKQPESEYEKEEVLGALENCPTCSIHFEDSNE